jgi:hypothetical protein
MDEKHDAWVASHICGSTALGVGARKCSIFHNQSIRLSDAPRNPLIATVLGNKSSQRTFQPYVEAINYGWQKELHMELERTSVRCKGLYGPWAREVNEMWESAPNCTVPLKRTYFKLWKKCCIYCDEYGDIGVLALLQGHVKNSEGLILWQGVYSPNVDFSLDW